jgi:anti-sigma factor RsiW
MAMEPTLDENFDPQLRGAIKRVRGGHVASPQLRDKIERSLAARSAMTPERGRPRRSRPIVWFARLAIAACLVLAGGVLQQIRHEWKEEREYGEANNTLLVAMANAHAHPSADAVMVASFSNPDLIRQELDHRLARHTPLPDLHQLGWTLSQASVTPLNGAVTARYDFVKDTHRATVFSIPQFAFAGAHDGQTYDIVVNNHPISGYITADGVHCIVGDTGMPLDQLAALRKQLQNH